MGGESCLGLKEPGRAARGMDIPRVFIMRCSRPSAHFIDTFTLALPLVVKGEVVGGFSVGDSLGRVYTDEDLRLAQTFADQAAVALENARLLQAAEERRRESVALGRVSQTLAQSLHPVVVAQRVVDSVRELLGAMSAFVYRVVPASGALEETARSGRWPRHDRPLRHPAGTGAVGLAVGERCAVVSRDVLTDPRLTFAPESLALIEASPIRAVLAVPLTVKGQVIGALALFDGGSCALTGNFLGTATFGSGEPGEAALTAADGAVERYDSFVARFGADGKLQRPAYVTVLHNGVLVQNHTEIQGHTYFEHPATYRRHAEKLPLVLMYHGNPVRFRNIWIREFKELEGRPGGKKGIEGK